MKLLSDLNSLLSELQTWTDSPNRDHQVAALKSFANRAKEIITGEPTGDTRLITVELPKSDHGTRKLICQAINQTLEARGLAYQTTGTRFTITGEASPAPAGQTGIAEAVKALATDEIHIRKEGTRHPLMFSSGVYYFLNMANDGKETLEAAIREQLAAGVTVWSGDKEVVGDQPGLPLVPLGLNCTESGRKVEVIRNDLKEGHPVVARIYREDGTYFLAEYLATGMPHGGLEANMRLVGHIPPEPPKPREVWADLDDRGCFLGTQTTPKDGYVHFREVLPAAGKQYHVWVRDGDSDFLRAAEVLEDEAARLGYRKAILIEATP